jgi:sn-glycerol 3-phosphate transport system ATP-binding protein
MTLGDRLIVMNSGRAEQIGRPLQVYEQPATTFVAGFLGSPAMNLLPAQLATDAQSVELGGLRLAVKGPRERGGLKVTLGIRPEHVARAQGEADAIPFVVAFVEPLGADTLAHGHLGNCRLEFTVRLPGNVQVAAGNVLSLVTAPENLHLFDATTGARL